MKNRNAKRILAAGAAAVLAVGLTACGGKENKACLLYTSRCV